MLLLLLAEVFLRSFGQLRGICFFIKFLKVHFVDVFGLLAVFLFDRFQLLIFFFLLPWSCNCVCVRLMCGATLRISTFLLFGLSPELIALNPFKIEVSDGLDINFGENEWVLDQIWVLACCYQFFCEEKHFLWIAKDTIVFYHIQVP
jgi:hypothetical protein